MEIKFKKGDKVKAVSESSGWGGIDRGDIGVFNRIRERDGRLLVDFPKHEEWVCTHKDLELVSQFKPELGEFRPIEDAITKQKAVVADEQRKLSAMFKKQEIDARIKVKKFVIEMPFGTEYPEGVEERMDEFTSQFEKWDKIRITTEYIGDEEE